MSVRPTLDLVVLVADADQRETLRNLLRRGHSLGVSDIGCRFLSHPRRDPGCFREGPQVLRPFLRQASHALVVFDREGSGREDWAAERIESDLRQRLTESGWEQRAEVVVIDPELEAWVWSDSPHVDDALGWKGRDPTLRSWLEARGMWAAKAPKPSRPKECLQRALLQSQVCRSAAIYGLLASKVSVERCMDRSFLRLREILRIWFGTPS